MTPEQITALAAACENGAMWLRWLRKHADEVRMVVPTERIERELEAHARALRDGRWTYSGEASNGE